MSDAWIAGASMTVFGRTTESLQDLTEEATRAALDDASITPTDVDQVYFGNAAAGLLQGQEMIRGQVLLQRTGLLGKPIINVENACASSGTALFLAVNAVRSGVADVALAVGAEQLVVPARTRTFAALAGATDLGRRPEMRRIVYTYALGEPDGAPIDLAASPFMAHYATKWREYTEHSDAEVEDLARVVVKSRQCGALNPRAQLRAPVSIDEVLQARMVSEPLRVPMCAPIGNGAAAVVVMSERGQRRYGAARVRVRGAVLVSNDPSTRDTPTQRAAQRAYEESGVEPRDVDVVELHDAAAPAELMLFEDLGLCGRGDAVELLRSGCTAIGGERPVNPSGGLLSRGHPIGATGCAQIVELNDQLRGRCGRRQVEGARIGLAQNAGGVLERDEATVVVSVLEAVR